MSRVLLLLVAAFGACARISDTVPSPVMHNVVPGRLAAFVSWSSSLHEAEYTVTAIHGITGSKTEMFTNATSLTVAPLEPDISYTFHVVARTSVGQSPPSSLSLPVTPSAFMVPSSKKFHSLFQPAFQARLFNNVNQNAGTSPTTDKVDFDTVEFDLTSSFSAATAVFTAPQNGIYQFGAELLVNPGANTNQLIVNVVTTSDTFRIAQAQAPPTLSAQFGMTGTVMCALSTSDTVELDTVILTSAGSATTTVNGGHSSQFWGFWVSPKD